MTEVWTDEVDVPQYAGGTFRAIVTTVWEKVGDRWRRASVTVMPKQGA